MAGYSEKEISAYSGRPIEVYRFSRSDQVWLYTSADKRIKFNEETYIPIPIERTEIDQSQELRSGGVDITVPRNNDLACTFIAGTPPEYTWLQIKRFHRDALTSVQTIFVGRVANVQFENSNAVIKCNPIYDAVSRKLCRVHYQGPCNNVIYDSHCKVISENWKIDAVVESNTPLSITSPDFSTVPDNWLKGGYLKYGLEYRLITSHSGNTIKILTPIANFGPGSQITVYAGCDRTEETCDSKFNNLDNFVGWTHIPQKNPFDSNAFR